MGDVLGVILGPSAPGLLDPERSQPVARPVLRGLGALDHELTRQRPDALVVVSARWLTTFHHYVAGAPRFGGDRGDPGLARSLVVAGRAYQVPVILTEEPAPPLGDLAVTAIRSLAAAAEVPIVPLSVCHLADLAQSLRWGRAIGAAVRAARRRALLVLAGAAGQGPRSGRDSGLMALFATAEPGRAGGPLDGGPRPVTPTAVGSPLALLLGALGPDPRRPVAGARAEPAPVTLLRN
jgi:hypothetical protein